MYAIRSYYDYQSRIPIFNNKKIKIGEELLYKHYNVKKGYIEVSLYVV